VGKVAQAEKKETLFFQILGRALTSQAILLFFFSSSLSSLFIVFRLEGLLNWYTLGNR